MVLISCMQPIKHIARVILIAYLVIGLLLSLYDSIALHGITGILAGEQDHRDLTATFQNLLWPMRLLR